MTFFTDYCPYCGLSLEDTPPFRPGRCHRNCEGWLESSQFTVTWQAAGCSQVNYYDQPMTEARALEFKAWADGYYPGNTHEVIAWELVQREAPKTKGDQNVR